MPSAPGPTHPRTSTVAIAVEPPAEKKSSRPNTSAFKVVPETRELRDRVRAEAARFAAPLDRSKAFSREQLRQMAEGALKQMGLGEQYLGFMMVCIANEFWREQVQAIPFNR